MKGLDAVFRSVASSAGGAWLLALLASGLFCYGLYCLIEARYRDLAPGPAWAPQAPSLPVPPVLRHRGLLVPTLPLEGRDSLRARTEVEGAGTLGPGRLAAVLVC